MMESERRVVLVLEDGIGVLFASRNAAEKWRDKHKLTDYDETIYLCTKAYALEVLGKGK